MGDGQILSVASLARDAEVSRTTVSGYLEILEDTLLAFRLPAYEGGLRVRERRHPKLFWIDAGLVRAIRRQRAAPSAEEQGALFEGWIANLLRIHDDYNGLFDEWYYWAPGEAAQTEVDFLLRRGRDWIAIEAKSTTRADAADRLRGLRAIDGLKGLRRRILVYRGTRRMTTADGIEIWPVDHLLSAIEHGTLWP